ncbi:Fungal specific transcription factor [Cordyceps fumosorosea ARSEF 2679]|uniref:Fungal specific transcription factor n=1 Tax=Cordyceps fumosorosea (strain ARSEF 2679) TaxID=1081104 RepID=A0A162M9I1_CORFA|nr:Fungal specific transcription factor [Cordyceps fumosorosea ARSEF 2679]OAA52930.1 Fungal specific transcription factor [Cordyceps fumosorosea ARSEF 2679]
MPLPEPGEKNPDEAAGPTPSATVSSERDARVGRAGAGGAGPKPRSCVTCRSRKVRCDKKTPCSNCRRAQIQCVLPSDDKPPRWARRLDRLTQAGPVTAAPADAGSNQVMSRLQNLEKLVKSLSAELHQARATGVDSAHTTASSPSTQPWQTQSQPAESPASAGSGSQSQKKPGRLIPGNSGRNQYVASGFWSQISDELDSLKMETEHLTGGDSDSSDDDISSPATNPSTMEMDRTPAQRHAFLFGSNLRPQANTRDCCPLPSQVPFLIDVFATNVNMIAQVAHVPTVRKMVRDVPGGDLSTLSPADSALMFAIYYAAVTSMEETDVSLNFGTTKAKLNLKFRVGFEQAMAIADFLNNPTLVLVQAMTIFLFLARRHDSPRFIWMMAGIAIRMAQAIGLHRDGSHFPNLTPYEVEIRRRVWWALIMLDARASGDQGTDLTILQDGFDTRMPLNINDSDISVDTKVMPEERDGITDMTVTQVSCGLVDVERKMVAKQKESPASPDASNAIFEELFARLDHSYLRYSNPNGDITYWVGVITARLVAAKMTLVLYLPTIISAPQELESNQQRDKLLVAAIEVAEYNHALNSEERCKHWRWVFQTYTHTYAIVYMLLSATQRPWSPLLERAWLALQSQWLIPAQYKADKEVNIWVPIRKLTVKARRHRDAEFGRLRQDPAAVQRLEEEYQRVTQPASPGPFAGQDNVECIRSRWLGILSMHTYPVSTNELPAAPGDNYNNLGPGNANSSPSQDARAGGPSGVFQSHVTGDSLSGLVSTGSSAQPMSLGFEPWGWDGTEPVSGFFTNTGVDDMDALEMDLDVGVDWSSLLATAELD